MRSKVIFGHPKWPPKKKFSIDIQNGRWQPFCQKFPKKTKLAYRSGQKCDRKWISDIQNVRRQPFCQKFPKKIKLRIDLKWPEMRSKVNFGHPKWPPGAILKQISQTFFFSQKLKLWYWSEMVRNAIQSDFWTSKMATGGHFFQVFNLFLQVFI